MNNLFVNIFGCPCESRLLNKLACVKLPDWSKSTFCNEHTTFYLKEQEALLTWARYVSNFRQMWQDADSLCIVVISPRWEFTIFSKSQLVCRTLQRIPLVASITDLRVGRAFVLWTWLPIPVSTLSAGYPDNTDRLHGAPEAYKSIMWHILRQFAPLHGHPNYFRHRIINHWQQYANFVMHKSDGWKTWPPTKMI